MAPVRPAQRGTRPPRCSGNDVSEPPGCRCGGREDGQATVELALCLPVVAVLLLLVVQAGLVVADQVAVVQGAREGARRASVDPDPDGPRRAVLGGRLTAARTSVTMERLAGPPAVARVTVRHRAATDVPLVGPLLPDVELTASAAMAVEGQ